MCGIAGIYNFSQKPVSEIHIRKMMQIQKHRGPDDEGIFIENNIGFGYVRLSIIDLSMAGHQPMTDLSGRYVMICNGEIYNYIEIRKELEAKGIVFRSKSDSEVLLNAYIEWGEECLNKFNGMFALAIYDKQKKTIFAARDRFGVKPFYYYLDEKNFIFASEIPAILSILQKKPLENKQSIFDFLLFNRTDQTESTFFKGIKKLQHGHKINIENNKLFIKKWYDLQSNIKDPFNDAFEFKQVFSDAVRLRLRSDVPVGVCLSGGLDSSSIVSIILKEHKKENLNTFSAIYGETLTGDESKFINEYKCLLHNMFFVVPDAQTFFRDLNDLIQIHAEPFPSTSPYAEYKVMELAKDHVTVLLDGQGSDEQLGGYHYFFGFYYKELFKQFQWLLLLDEIIAHNKNHHSFYDLQSFGYFLLPSFLKSFLKSNQINYLQNDFVHEYLNTNEVVDNLYNSKNLKDSLIDHFEYKLEHLLKWADRNSMRFSLELRSPFLDYRLVEKTLALPSNMKIRKGMTKYILRESMNGILPEIIRQRSDKIGFSTPEADWFRSKAFVPYIEELINSKSFSSRGIFDVKRVLKMHNLHISGKVNYSKEIWKCIHLENWYRVFID